MEPGERPNQIGLSGALAALDPNFVDRVQVGLMVVDRDYRIVLANRSLERWFRRGRDEMHGQRCYAILHERDAVCPDCPAELTFRTGFGVSVTHTGRDRAGSVVYTELTTQPVLDQSGAVSHVIELAQDISDAIYFEREILHRNRQLAGLNALANLVSESLDSDDILALALDKVLEVAEAEVGAILLAEDEDLVLHARKGYCDEPPGPPQATRVRMGEGLAGLVASTGQPVIDTGQVQYPPEQEALRQREGVHSAVGVPLTAKGKTVGVMVVGRRRDQSFSNQDVALLDAMGKQVGMGIENARLLQQVEQQLRAQEELSVRAARQLEAVLNAVRDVSQSLDLDQCLRNLAGTLGRTLDIAYCRVCLLAPDGTALTPKATYVRDQTIAIQEPDRPIPLCEAGPAAAVIERGEMVEIQSADSELLSPSEREQWQSLGLQSGLRMPLMVRGHGVGIVALSDTRARRFSEDERRLCRAIARQAAVAVEHAMLYGSVEEERERLDAVIANASDGITILDADRRIVSMNPAVQSFTGWASAEVVGQHCWEIFGPRDKQGRSLCETNCPLEGPLASGVAVPYLETKIRTKEGAQRDVSVSYSRMRSPLSGEPYVIAITRDIGAAKQVEQMRDEFVSLISHDLRAPLTVILLQARLLQQSLAGHKLPRERASAEAIANSAKRLEAMVADLVDATWMESGRLSLRRRAVAVGELIAGVVQRGRALDTGHVIRTEVEDGLPPVAADSDRVERVLTNVLTNAMKYSRAGSEVKVSAWLRGGEVIIAIADQGRGIAPEHLPHIFERMYRSPGIGKAEGLGLGLYIAKLLVDAHGGRIWVESQVGHGSTFFVALPVASQAS